MRLGSRSRGQVGEARLRWPQGCAALTTLLDCRHEAIVPGSRRIRLLLRVVTRVALLSVDLSHIERLLIKEVDDAGAPAFSPSTSRRIRLVRLVGFLELVLDLKEQVLGNDAEAVPHFLNVALSLRRVDRGRRLRKVEQQNDAVVIVVKYRV